MAKSRFEYLLNAMERAAQHDEPASQGYGAKRAEVLRYVRGLEAVRDQAVTLGLAAASVDTTTTPRARPQAASEVIGG